MMHEHAYTTMISVYELDQLTGWMCGQISLDVRAVSKIQEEITVCSAWLNAADVGYF